MPTVSVYGYEVFYYDDDFTDPWRPSEVVLLNHYGTGDSTLYNRWVATLAPHYRVIRWDRPGHGRSQKPGLDYEMTVEGVLAGFTGFMNALGLERVHYIGDKVSSAVGIALAATQPERIKSLVLSACFLSGKRVREHFLRSAQAVLDEGTWSFAYRPGATGVRPDDTPERRMQSLYYSQVQSGVPAHLIASAYRLVASPAFDVEPFLSKVQAPTLLLSPDSGGQLITMEEQELIRTTIPNCEQHVFAGGTAQLPYYEADWCAEHALRFIQKHGYLS
ncbi:MAG TPA: alpha/beta fold hydrolase [Dehalococcoidia bacterium]|nr:alpha/beta fold hydrolase [Dehalococcoidia bacterium]